MAGKIKGITVKIGGDTTGLDKALSKSNKESAALQSELTKVNRLLKFDPQNTVMLTQKQQLLAGQIETTATKLDALRQAEKQVQDQVASGTVSQAQYRDFQREIVNTEQKLKSLKKQAEDFEGGDTTGLDRASAKLKDFGDKTTKAGKKMLPISGMMTAVGGLAVKTAIDFDNAMSQVAGALDRPQEEIENLRNLAIQMGKDTIFSASECGAAMVELAKGGLTEADIQAGALKSTMDLAASSGMDLGSSANTVVQAMGAFGLSANDSKAAVNALAGAAAASSADVRPLTEGLSQCAAQANNAGWSIQDTTAVLGAFADKGIKGSDAGTSLKTMLQRLAAPTDKAAEMIHGLGINVRDQNGQMLDAAGIAQELQNKLGGLTSAEKDAALQTIFGSDATRAATVMVSEGAKGIEKYTKATNDQKAAQRLADSQMGESGKNIEELKGSMETLGIVIGEKILPIVNKIALVATDLVNRFGSLSAGTQTLVIATLGIVAAAGPLLMIIGGMASGFGAVGAVVGRLIPLITGTATSAELLSKAVSILCLHPVVAVITAIIAAVMYLWNTNEGFRNFIIGCWTSIKENVGGAIGVIGNFFTETLPGAGKEMLAWFKGLPDEFVAVGKRIITGLWKGLSGAKDWLFGKVEGIGTGMVEKIKGVLGIKSPSRVFAEIGRFVMEGFGKGIEESKDVPGTALDGISKKALEKVQAEAKSYKDVGTLYVNEMTKGINEQAEKSKKAVETFIDRQINAMSVKNPKAKAEYAAMGKDTIAAYSEAIEDGKKSAIDKISSTISTLTDEAQKQYDGLVNQRDNMISKLSEFGGLFDIDNESGDLQIANIEANIDALDRYEDALTRLKEKGVSDEFMSKVTALGPEEGTQFAESLLSLEDTRFEEYITNWETQQSRAREIAGKFYSDELDALEKDFSGKLDAALAEVPTTVKDVGVNAMNGFINGMDSLQWKAVGKAREIADAVILEMQRAFDINSPSRVMRDFIGGNVISGLAQGLDNGISKVKAASDRLAGAIAMRPASEVNVQTETGSIGNDIANIIGTQVQLANQSPLAAGILHVVVELGGQKVGEQIVKLGDAARRSAGPKRVVPV